MASITRNTFYWLILLAVLTGCSGKKDASGDDKHSDGKPGDGDKGSDPRPAKADFSLTPIAFRQEYERDKVAFVKKYAGKTVELTGVVKDMETMSVEPQLFLNASSTTSAAISAGRWGEVVACGVRDPDIWNKVVPGQTIKLRGQVWDAENIGTRLIKGQILEVTGAKPESITAEQLAKECAADFEALNTKYAGKHLFVTGEIERSEKNEKAAAWEISLKTPAPHPYVRVFVDRSPDEDRKSLTKGQRITVLCWFGPEDRKAAARSEGVTLREGRIWK